MESVFWDAHGILFIDYLEKGKTINSDYYMVLLDRLSSEKTEAYFESKDESFYKKGIARLEKRWTECIKLEGNYVDE